MAVIGIDFGSSYSTVAYKDGNGNVKTVEFRNCTPANKYPSVILYKGTENFIFGPDALSYFNMVMGEGGLTDEEKVKWMSRFVPCLKMKMESEMGEIFDDNAYPYQLLLQLFLDNLIKQAQVDTPEIRNIDKIVFSYPVNFDSDKKDMMYQAFSELGYSNVEAVYEPIAAVRGYGQKHCINDNEGILVFDFGGGTIDVAYVKKMYNGELKTNSVPKGNSRCGGNDIDQMLYEHVEKLVKRDLQLGLASEKNLPDAIIIRKCRELKELLNNPVNPKQKEETQIFVWDKGKPYEYVFSIAKDTFNAIIAKKVEEAISVAIQVRDDVRQDGNKIDKVLLIGGSSQLSLVHYRLSQILEGVPIETFGGADVAVAVGTLVDDYNIFKLIYMVDGEEYKSINMEFGATITPEEYPIKVGYTFSGWSNLPEKMPANDITVTGLFTANKPEVIWT